MLLVTLATAVTAILLAVPRSPPEYFTDDEDGGSDSVDIKDDDEDKIYDNIWIWKIALIVIMFVFSAAGGLAFLSGHCSETIYPQPIKKAKLQQ